MTEAYYIMYLPEVETSRRFSEVFYIPGEIMASSIDGAKFKLTTDLRVLKKLESRLSQKRHQRLEGLGWIVDILEVKDSDMIMLQDLMISGESDYKRLEKYLQEELIPRAIYAPKNNPKKAKTKRKIFKPYTDWDQTKDEDWNPGSFELNDYIPEED